MSPLAAIVLAAGKSTRMKSVRPKVMHSLAGWPVIAHVLEVARALETDPLCVVVSRAQRELVDYLKSHNVTIAYQKEQRGTADAVTAAKGALKEFEGHVLILCGDVPLLGADELDAFVQQVTRDEATVGVLTMELDEPGRYGRIVKDLDERVVRIVEAKDATDNELAIREVNTGVFCVEKEWLFRALKKIQPHNVQKEYYLTDIVAIALQEGRTVVSHVANDAHDCMGINTRVELSMAAERMRERINRTHQLAGVGIVDFRHTSIDAGVTIGQDTEIWPHTFLIGATRIGKGCSIENGVVLKDAIVGDRVHIKSYSVIEKSVIAHEAIVGPFARIRPDSVVGKKARVGNFVELKKATLGEGAKANHLTYLGDASVGTGANIGCGTITCNYDGVAKHRTVIGAHAFVGSDVQFIAPVRVGAGATIGAGSTITRDVPPHALALARAEQVVVKRWRKK